MKKKHSGCCFFFLCLLFLLPGVILIRDRLPDAETILALVSQAREEVKEVLPSAEPRQTISEEEKAALLSAGQGENGCAYYYWQLSEEQQIEYMKYLNGIRSMEEEITLSLDADPAKQIVKMVFADHPELFWAEQSYEYLVYDSRVEIHPRYTVSYEEKEQRQQQIELTVQESLGWIPSGASAYEIVKALYSYVVQTVDYDLASSDNQNIYSSMVNRVSVCTGYAKELQYLLQRVGIQALCVEGTAANQEAHAWLIASVDGSWYHIDPTYGDPAYRETSAEDLLSIPEALQVDYAYLCMDDASILRDRTVSADLEIPSCSAVDLLYYPLHGLLFYSYDEEVLVSLQESIAAGQNYWEGQFADDASYQEMLSAMQEGTFANLVLANRPELGAVRMHMSYRDESRVVKLWY
ncbi:MAG: transglutaminase domain-containing protein [Lachnospiraceae bacterium]|nr:transglutaminase domain-containing protein [Lachnospiraceae bacterium]